MEERWGAAKDIERGQIHAITNEAGVVDQVAARGRLARDDPDDLRQQSLNILMGQHGGLGVSSRTTRELQIADIVGAKCRLAILKKMSRL